MGKTDCVIYDCDGVMFDSIEANGKLYNHIAASIGRGPLSKDETYFCHTHTVYESIEHIAGHDRELESKARDVLKQVNFADYIIYLKMEPNLLEALSELKKRGIIRAISTSRTTSMPHIMDMYKLSSYFDMVVTALDVTHPKPHPESVEKILKAFNLSKENVLYIGDSDVDRVTALSSGVRFIAYKNHDIAVDGLINDHLSLIDFL